jgi:glycosyltransferase involved in cell wall biosynthesis
LINGSVAVVAIGRNEGQRLQRCLESVIGTSSLVVYVDSGSSDGSVELARRLGCEVVELDMSIPFTAARARNAGFRHLQALRPDLRYTFFVDGDCEVRADWPDTSLTFLDSHPQVAAVSGRNQEKFPQRSVYNLMCDFDWDQPPGPAKLFGGNVVIRNAAMLQVGGFREDLIAGEEPELAVRLRALGWQIHRLADHMTLHDANILSFRQWWTRTKRGGYAYTEGAAIHGAPPERHFVRQARRITIWGGLLPALILALGIMTGWAFLLLLIYPAQVLRIAIRGRRSPRENCVIAFFLVIGRFAEFSGQLKYFANRLSNRNGRLIEYK